MPASAIRSSRRSRDSPLIASERPDDVVLAPPRSVLKTSSGKIRRTMSRELYEQGALGRTQRAPWWQLTRAVARRLAGMAWRAGCGPYRVGLWAWSVFFIASAGAWLTTMILPGVDLRRRAARAWARCALRLSGIHVRVEGLDRLPTSAAVVVANHASYADSILLTATLPPRFGYAVKRELATAALLGRRCADSARYSLKGPMRQAVSRTLEFLKRIRAQANRW